MSRWIFAAAIAVTATCLASTAAAATPVPKLLSCSGIALSRPAGTVVLSCADGNTELKGTHWRSWGAHEAIGSTDFGVNLCTPTCVASRMRFFAASTVTLLDPERTSRGLLFSRAVIAYTLDGSLQDVHRLPGYLGRMPPPTGARPLDRCRYSIRSPRPGTLASPA